MFCSRRRGGNGSDSGSSRAGNSGYSRLYSDETAGIKVEPIVVLVVSLVFIGSVFLLHIWGKYTRAA